MHRNSTEINALQRRNAIAIPAPRGSQILLGSSSCHNQAAIICSRQDRGRNMSWKANRQLTVNLE
jgi:hypothetical protein